MIARRGNGTTVRLAALADPMETSLQHVEFCVTAVGADQFVVTAVLDDASGLQRDDAIGSTHRRQAMGDDEDGTSGRDPLHVLLDGALALVIEGAGRLVENENTGIADQSTCH